MSTAIRVSPITGELLPVMTALGGATTVAVLGYLVQCSTLGGAITVRAPLGGSEGSIFAVEDIDGNAGLSPITVLGNGSQLDDAPSFLINQGFGYSTWVYDRGQWRRLVTRRRLDGVGSDKVVNPGGGLNARALLLEFAADGSVGSGSLEVPDLASLLAVIDTLESDQTAHLVTSLRQSFELDKASTAVADGIAVLNTWSSMGGALPGRWLRLLSPEPHWANQISWWVDSVAGNDENVGDADVAGRRLKTVAEVGRRLMVAKAGKNYQVNVVSDLPANDRFRMTFVVDPTNLEDVTASGAEQIFNLVLNGRRTVIASSALTGAGYVPSAANTQATMTDAAFPGGVAAHIGDMVVLTSGPNAGAIGWIGKDLGAGVARMTDFISPSNALVGAQAAGTTYDLVSLTKWNGSLIQIGSSQGRYQWNNFDFPAPPAPPADQQNIAIRNCNFTFRACRFARVIALDFGASYTVGASAFVFPAAGGAGVGGTTVQAFLGSPAFTLLDNLFLNTDLRILFGVTVAQLQSNYIEHGVFQTRTNTPLPTYGALLAAAGTIGPGRIVIVGNGLGVYDSPPGVGSWGCLIADDAVVRVGAGANIRGDGAETGVVVRSSSKLLVATGVVPTIVGTTNDLLFENAPAAMPPLDASAGLVLPALAPLTTWAQWAAAPFSGNVVSYKTGSAIVTVP